MIRKARLYVLRDPRTNEIRYVGVTVLTLRTRLAQHWCGKANDKTHRANWLRGKQLDVGQTSVFSGLVICGIVRRSKSEAVRLKWRRRRQT